MDSLVEHVFEYGGGVLPVNITNASVIVSGEAYDWKFARTKKIPWREPYEWLLNDYAAQPEKIKDILGKAADAASSGIMATIDLLESRTCTLADTKKKESTLVAAGSIMR